MMERGAIAGGNRSRRLVPTGALDDLRLGLGRWRLSLLLAWKETVLPLRRAYLGPLWIPLQTALWLALILVFFSDSLGRGRADYPVYVAAGLATFSVLSVFFQDGANAFLRQAGLIQNVPNPYSIYVYKVAFKAAIVAVFQAPVIAAALLLTQVAPTLSGIGWCFAGLLGVGVLFLGVAFVMAAAAAAINDTVPLSQTAMRFLFFCTPLFWYAETRGGLRGALVHANPFAHFIAIVREPLLTGSPPVESWRFCVIFGFAAGALGLIAFAVVRRRLSLWV